MGHAAPIWITVDGPDWLVIETEIEGLSPTETMRWFVEAPLLNQWWGEEALIEPRPGGIYHVHWSSMNWTMRGTVAHCSSDTLAYSWTWDHEPDQPARTVVVHASACEVGSRVTISHGPYRPEESRLTGEDADRESHRDGWMYFLPILHAKIAEAVSQSRGISDEPGSELGR
jgi:hypothetical protein